MATVNKQSLREEFDALKGEFERLCASGKMAADSRALFQSHAHVVRGADGRVHGKAHPKKQRQLQQTSLPPPFGFRAFSFS